MGRQQRNALDQLLRDAPLDLGGDVAERRDIFEEMMAEIPVPRRRHDVVRESRRDPGRQPRGRGQ